MWLSVALIGAVALVLRIWAASLGDLPDSRGHRLLLRRRAKPRRGTRPRERRRVELPDASVDRAAAGVRVWMPLPTLLAAIPMAIFGTGYAVAQSVSGDRRLADPDPCLAARADVATERALPLPRARVLALGAGLTAAVELPSARSTRRCRTRRPSSRCSCSIGCLLIPRILRAPRAGAWRAAVRDARLWALGSGDRAGRR